MKWNAYLISAAIASMTLVACSEDDPVNPDNNNPDTEEPDTENPADETVEGNVSGVWEANSVIKVSGHIVVPEGESLTIEEGVQVIFDDAGVGANHAPIEFTVDGNLYCEGTAENPVRLTVAEEDRTEANTFAGLWGGIVASNTCAEMLIDHTIIEYTGKLSKVLRLQPTVFIPQVMMLIHRSRPTTSTENISLPTLSSATVGRMVSI